MGIGSLTDRRRGPEHKTWWLIAADEGQQVRGGEARSVRK